MRPASPANSDDEDDEEEERDRNDRIVGGGGDHWDDGRSRAEATRRADIIVISFGEAGTKLKKCGGGEEVSKSRWSANVGNLRWSENKRMMFFSKPALSPAAWPYPLFSP